MHTVLPAQSRPCVNNKPAAHAWSSAMHHQTTSPGVLETLASDACPVSMLMSDDLPTLDLPMTANSGSLRLGHCARLTLLLTYCAVFTRTCQRQGLVEDQAPGGWMHAQHGIACTAHISGRGQLQHLNSL